MRRERLKDQIDEPRVSLLDLCLRATVALICIGAVTYALIGRAPARKLPEPQPCDCGVNIPVGSQVTLTATRNECFYWNTQGPLPLDHFAAHFSNWLKITKAPRVTITAHASARFGDALRLLEEARRQGVTGAQLVAQARPNP